MLFTLAEIIDKFCKNTTCIKLSFARKWWFTKSYYFIYCLQAPIHFFDVTPIGRIVNRFSSDVYSIDDSLPFIMNIFLAQIYGILGTIVVTCYGLPWFVVLLLPLGLLYYKIQVCQTQLISLKKHTLVIVFILSKSETCCIEVIIWVPRYLSTDSFFDRSFLLIFIFETYLAYFFVSPYMHCKFLRSFSSVKNFLIYL